MALECLLTVGAIILPATLLTMMVRRWFEAVPWKIAALFLLLATIFLWKGIFTSNVPVPVDEAARGYPYEGIFGRIESKNPLTNDTTRLFLPWMAVVREELSSGRAPLWNRYSFSGYPLLANGESAPFYPPFLATLIVPLPRQIVAMAALKLFSALLFTYLLIRREGVDAAAACFAAVAFTFSTFQTVYLFYSTTAVTSLFPATIYALLNAVDRPHRKSSLILVAGMVAVLQTAGHPESVLHCALAAVGFLLIEAIAPVHPIDRAQAVAAARTIVIGTIGGLLLAAPAWIPVLEQVRLSTRFAEIAVAGRHMTPPFPGAAAYALLNPDLFGHPARGNWNWLMNYSIVASSYVGLLPLALLPLAILGRPLKAEASFSDEAMGDRLQPVRRSASSRSLLSRVNHLLRDRSLLLAIFAIAMFIVAMNWTPLARIANSFPPLSLVANDKLRFAACLVTALCAARVAQRMQHCSRWFDGFGIAVVVGAAFVIWLKRDVVTWQSWVAVAGAAIFWLFAATARSYRTYIPHAAAIVTTIELFLLNMPFNAAAERRFYKPALPIVESLRALRSEEPFRVVGEGWTLMPNASALYQLEDIRGSDPMSLAGYTSFLSLASVSEPGIDVQRIDDLGQSALDFLNVRYALAPPDYAPPPGWLEIYRGPDGKLFQNAESLPRFFVPRNVVRRDTSIPLLEQLRTANLRESVIAEDFERADQPRATIATRSISPTRFAITIRADRPLFVASSQPLAPGWTASTAGKRLDLRAVNGAFIGFELPAGDHQIEVVYRPISFYGSFALTVLGVALLWFFGRSRATAHQR